LPSHEAVFEQPDSDESRPDLRSGKVTVKGSGSDAAELVLVHSLKPLSEEGAPTARPAPVGAWRWLAIRTEASLRRSAKRV